MPALQLAPGVVRVVINGTLSGQPTAAVMHSYDPSYSGAHVTQGNLDATAAGFRAAWAAQFLTKQSSADFVLLAATAQDLSFADGLIGTAGGSTTGAQAGSSLPANVAMCISWRVAMHYRGGHGRTYLPGLVQIQQASATSWTGTVITQMTTAANNFMAAANTTMGTRPSTFVILRRVSGGHALVPPQPLLVTSAVIDTRIDSMRRRLGKDR